MNKDQALSFLDGLLIRKQGTLFNKAEDKAINILKEIIISDKVEITYTETILQDILAITLNEMIPKYQVNTKNSKGRNLITYYKLQENLIEEKKEVKKLLLDNCLKALDVTLHQRKI